MHSTLIIDNKIARRIASGELWFPRSVVVGRKQELPGIVTLIDQKRDFIANAFCSPNSRYYLKIISTKNKIIDYKYWDNKICDAYLRRKPLCDLTDAYRVVYSESDGIPSVVIDKYNDIWTFQITSEGAETIKRDIIDIICKKYDPKSIIEKNDTGVREKEGLPLINQIVFGEKSQTTIREDTLKFQLDVLNGNKTGAYLDYRQFRLKAAELAFGDVLDLFCYHGWLSCHIAKKTNSVIAVDISGDAIDAAKINAELNRVSNINFIRSDCFRYLEDCEKTFDFIHVDPPAFAKSLMKVKSAMMGYEKLIRNALRILKPNGVIMISACSHAISERILEEAVLKSIKKANKSAEI
ncbi:class I SAM-dependent methyltransferase, partial [bacterium]|nr:class I SAM-dependent methyltransferase [bacterium]